jgi:pimeloyl-ACP methyl ester carboxylesterase
MMKGLKSAGGLRLAGKGAMICALLVTGLFASAAKGAEIKSAVAPFEGTTVYYQTRGSGNEALIFVHGWTCSSEFWRGQVSAFPGVRIIAIDLPGHGKSGKPQTDYTMSYFARSIEAVMRHAKVMRAVLVGHSMGTPVVRQFYRLYPDKTMALVIVDGSLRWMMSKEQTQGFMAQLQGNYKAFAPQMVDMMTKPVKDDRMKGEIRTTMLGTPDYVAISAMKAMADETIYTQDPIKVPVLAVMAKSSHWAPDTESYMRSLAPDLEYYEWDGVSHFVMADKPQELNQMLQAFLTKHKLLTH